MRSNDKNWSMKDDLSARAQVHNMYMIKNYYDEIVSCQRKTVNYIDYRFTDSTEENSSMKIGVSADDSVSAIFKYHFRKTAVLNFASYKHPGGAYLEGSRAQEEMLCHESTLYNILTGFVNSFYELNRKMTNNHLYLNHALYSPDVRFLRQKETVQSTIKCDVITCAAPNRHAAQAYCGISDEENSEVLRSRIKYVLDIAKEQKVNTLILGAFGCGVFGQDPEEVASIFRELLNTTHKCFDKVIFAIPASNTNNNLDAFMKVFAKTNSTNLY